MPGGNSRLSKMGHQRPLDDQWRERGTEPYAGPRKSIRPGRDERQIAIIGASTDRSKFGNKAVRAYKAEGYTVWPVNPKSGEIEGLQVYTSIDELPYVPFLASLYLHENAALEALAALGDMQRSRAENIAVVYLNPGVETPTVAERAADEELYAVATCSIRAIGHDPAEYKAEGEPEQAHSAEDIERQQHEEQTQRKVPVGHATPGSGG